MMKSKQLQLECEWTHCNQIFSSSEDLHSHITNHVDELIGSIDDKAACISCGICHSIIDISQCDYDWLLRHVHFHILQTILREKGRLFIQMKNLPECKLDRSAKFFVPDLPTKFGCEWKYCDFTTNNVTVFYKHVATHPAEYTDSRYPAKIDIKCLWGNCHYISPSGSNLVHHLMSHTQEKSLACPYCGLAVISHDKLTNHLKRQAGPLLEGSDSESEDVVDISTKEVQSGNHQCLRCKRLYATKQLLNDHMRRHINTLKCPFCEATCPTKTGLNRHILFRHTHARPHSCEICHQDFKSLDILSRHMKTHNKVILSKYICSAPLCKFSSTTQKGLEVHVTKIHKEKRDSDPSVTGSSKRVYACHLCDYETSKGYLLSKHLSSQHNLVKPSGFSRLVYCMSDDGRYRLQRTRIDSVEVTAKLSQGEFTTVLHSTCSESQSSA